MKAYFIQGSCSLISSVDGTKRRAGKGSPLDPRPHLNPPCVIVTASRHTTPRRGSEHKRDSQQSRPAQRAALQAVFKRGVWVHEAASQAMCCCLCLECQIARPFCLATPTQLDTDWLGWTRAAAAAVQGDLDCRRDLEAHTPASSFVKEGVLDMKELQSYTVLQERAWR